MNHAFLTIMGLFSLIFGACSKQHSQATLSEQPPIPAELVGEWREPSGHGHVILRADGLAVCIGGPPPIGFPCLATYNPKNSVLTLSPRLSPAEMPKGARQPPDFTGHYDPKDRTITIKHKGTKAYTYKRHSEEVSEPYKSFDLQKLPPK